MHWKCTFPVWLLTSSDCLLSQNSRQMFRISSTWIIARMDTSDLIMPVASWCCCEWFDRHQKCIVEASLLFQLELNTPGLSKCPHRGSLANVERLYLENYLRTYWHFLGGGGRVVMRTLCRVVVCPENWNQLTYFHENYFEDCAIRSHSCAISI